MAEMTYLEAINLGISEEMARDEKVVIFGEDVGGDKGGVFGVTKGLAAKYGDERCFNTPLTEGLIGGLAVGLGLMGYRAIGEFQFADYILPATNQLLSEARTMRYRTKGDWTAPIVYQIHMAAVFVADCIILSLQKKFLWTTRIKSCDPF